jgi:glycosyltransferase involved in cell wall biosynthesis
MSILSKKKSNFEILENEKFETVLFLDNISQAKNGGNRTRNFFKFSEIDRPLVSIITVVYNGEKFIEETIKSVISQKYQNYEYIIIDGDSTDRTLEIIKKYDQYIDYWVSQKDLGIYDAFNKGMRLATGDFIGFVNSDDVYTDKALSYLVDYYLKDKNLDFIYGAVKKHWGTLHGYKPYKIYWSWGFYSSHSTGFFIKKKAAKIVGLYNLKYPYSADYDYFYRMIVHCKLKGVGTKKDQLFGIFRRGGFSSKINFFDHFCEEIKIRLDNKQNKLLILFIFILKFLKNLKKL